MALPVVEVEIFGEAVVRRRLLRMSASMVDAAPAFVEMAKILEEAVAADFSTQGQAGGVHWPDLAASTVERKERSSDPRVSANANTVLVATGRLRGSFHEGGEDHTREISEDEMRWGSKVPYGVYHQSTAPRERLPHRPIQLAVPTRRSLVRVLQAQMFGHGVDA